MSKDYILARPSTPPPPRPLALDLFIRQLATIWIADKGSDHRRLS